MLYKYVLVFIGAAIPWIEVLAVVPLGIIWGLSPAIVMITAFIGNMVTLIPVVIAFDRLKLWYVRRRQKQDKPSKKSVRAVRSEEHTSELQSRGHLVCRLLLEKKKMNSNTYKE